MNYSNTLKPNLVGEPYQIKQCSSFYLSIDFNWIYYLKEGYGHATNGVMIQHEVKCAPNNQCKCIVSMKTWYDTM